MIAILGPGGVGGFLAAMLARAGEDVVVVAREQTAEAIARDGARLESTQVGDVVAHPAATARLAEPVEVLFVATKAAGLEAALERIEAEPELVVPLLNGIDHVALLRERFGERAVVGAIRIEADRVAPGRIVHTSAFMHVELASDDPAQAERLATLAERLGAAGVPTRVGKSEAQTLWGKLVRLNALASMTSAYDLSLGAIRADPQLRAQLDACVEESAAVARAAGADIQTDKVRREIDGVHDAFTSSMQRDIAAGREPELDAILGAVLRAGAREGLPCPTVAELAERIAARAGVAVPVSG